MYPSPPDLNTNMDVRSLEDLSIPQLSVPPATNGASAPQEPFAFAPDLSADPAAITDLSAMMFPSPDPFAYPKQPMTSFDASNPSAFPASSADADTPMPPQAFFPDASQPAAAHGLQMPRAPDNMLEAQLYGPLPYLLPDAAAAGTAPADGVEFTDGFGGAMGMEGADEAVGVEGADLMGGAQGWGEGMEAWRGWSQQDFIG